MKFLAVFAALVAISASAPTTSWTLNDLSQAIQNPATPAAVLPYLEHALNQMMNAIFAGEQVVSQPIFLQERLLVIYIVRTVSFYFLLVFNLELLKLAAVYMVSVNGHVGRANWGRFGKYQVTSIRNR